MTIGTDVCPFVQDELCTGSPSACTTFTTQDNCTFTNCTWTVGVLFSGRFGNGPTDDATPTATFTTMGDTNWAGFWQALTDTDDIHGINENGKTATSLDGEIWDDTGGAEVAGTIYGVIAYGEGTIEGNQFECQLESDNSNTHLMSFETAFPDTNYAVMCTPGPNPDATICQLKDQTNPKTTAGFGVLLNGDNGAAETVATVNWCAFEYGEYSTGDMYIKAGNDAVTNGNVAVDFTDEGLTDYVDTNYVVFLTDITSYPSDGCYCEVSARTTAGFTALCSDDAGSNNNCDETFDWVTFSMIDADVPGGGSCSGTPKGCDNYTISDTCNNNTGCNEFANITQEAFVTGKGWEVNCTIGAGCTGVNDLFLEANFTTDKVIRNETETNAVDCGGAPAPGDPCTPPDSGQWNQTAWCNITTPTQVYGNLNCTNILNISSTLNFTSWDYHFILGIGCERIVAPPNGRYGWKIP